MPIYFNSITYSVDFYSIKECKIRFQWFVIVEFLFQCFFSVFKANISISYSETVC